MIPVIDTHIHLWKYKKNEYPWISDEMQVLKKDYFLNDYFDTKGSGSKVVLVQARQTEEETNALCDIANNSSEVLGVIGWANLQGVELEKKLAVYKTNKRYEKLVGFRHLIQDEAENYFMLRPNFTRGLEELAKVGYCYEVLLRQHQLAQFLEYLRRQSVETRPILILDHLAKPLIYGTKQEFLQWKEFMRDIARYARVYCKVSGLLTEAHWKNWKVEELLPFVEVILEYFGTSRIMLGSDWPVCLLSGELQDSLGLFEKLGLKLSEKEKQHILFDTAKQVYGPKL